MPDICPILSQYFQNICLTFEMSKILKTPKILKITTKCSTNLKNPKNLKIYKNLKYLKKYQTKKISKIPKNLFVFSDIYLINRKSKCVQFCSSLSPICTNFVLVSTKGARILQVPIGHCDSSLCQSVSNRFSVSLLSYFRGDKQWGEETTSFQGSTHMLREDKQKGGGLIEIKAISAPAQLSWG